jgi:hypothetical protein
MVYGSSLQIATYNIEWISNSKLAWSFHITRNHFFRIFFCYFLTLKKGEIFVRFFFS